MDSKDPPPFGYTFNTADFFGGSEPALTNSGPSLLSENENQSLVDFFTNTDPFLSEAPPFAPNPASKDLTDDFNWGFVPPATIHRVSTTIPDQAHLHHGFHVDQPFNPDPLSADHLANTQDDLQAASTLFTNAQSSHVNGSSYDMHGLPSSGSDPSGLGFHNIPLVATSHGPMNEQLAALLPNHSENGSIDAQIAAQFSQVHHRHLAEMTQLERQRPLLKRSYTYGTDNAFNPTGFVVSSPNETEDAVTRRLLQDLRHAQPLTKEVLPSIDNTKPSSPVAPMNFPIGLVELQSDEDGQSEDDSTDADEDDDRPAKKRRKSKNPIKPDKLPISTRKGIPGRSGKGRKASLDEPMGKKKRPSSAGQKAQRENLTEEQKRNNHILSEQKRRNLIKRGFDDLHELVPEIRNGGLSKSSVLMEAAAFLDKIIQDNTQFSAELAQSANG
ncbi:uncharacterized protein BDR25DRAFT_286877 [Lindgomyces ingoldianus]|uniref:Uncharacterized protein n=1 Tax=Lindgomyces ingoldianus TaxID=673940 RepID=A0ACB6QV06_9PLEO|nr:uncharacterized protein BDR25DRAFT_286877 [Lindgomyces ingoldianus]KAF2470702.1 hypothetical protein BDR25DRAFT_286877 [Lindgomyces ingoldianus]